MGETTGISWCDATFNPWVGCEKVSPGCAHCYAETLVTGRMGRGGTWGADGVRERTSASTWKNPLKWARTMPEQLGRRPRVFCASLADVFEPRPELDPWRHDLIQLVHRTPELDWLILTKRPDFAYKWLNRYADRFPDNVWLGTSIENSRFTWRVDWLRRVGVRVRFISAEPLLGSLFEDRAPRPGTSDGAPASEREPIEGGDASRGRAPLDLTGIDWVIVGGESGGRSARPMHPTWAKEIRDACKPPSPEDIDAVQSIAGGWSKDDLATLGVSWPPPAGWRRDLEQRYWAAPAFHFKQWGSWVYDRDRPDVLLGYDGSTLDARLAGDLSDHGNSFRLLYPMRYAGAAPTSGGHLLDGVSWREFPDTITRSHQL